MNIGMIDVDSHNFPNLALMKLSAYEKSRGNNVEWWNGLKHYDRVYQAKVFDDTYSKDNEFCIMADEVVGGVLDMRMINHCQNILSIYIRTIHYTTSMTLHMGLSPEDVQDTASSVLLVTRKV